MGEREFSMVFPDLLRIGRLEKFKYRRLVIASTGWPSLSSEALKQP